MKSSNALRPQKTSLPVQAPRGELLSSRNFIFVAVGLAAAVFFIYLPALSFQFILDDHRFLSDPRIQSSGHMWEYFSNYVWAQFSGGPASFYRPLFVFWLRVNFILSEMSPWGWHLLSIVKHVSVAVLLGLLVWSLLRDRVAALIAAGLFALHPAQTESVAWVTVPDPPMSVAVLCALLLFLRYTGYVGDSDSGGIQSNRRLRKSRTPVLAKPPVGWLVASAGACLAALLVKETAVIFPIVIFALVLMIPPDLAAVSSPADDRETGLKARLFRAIRLSVPFLCVAGLYLLMRFHALRGKVGTETQHLSVKTVLLSIPATLWFYIKVLLWPVRLRAFANSSERDSFSVNGVLMPGLAVFSAATVLAGVVFWAWNRAAKRDLPQRDMGRIHCALGLGTLLLVLPLLPALNLNVLNPGDFLHGRYTYLPLAGLMLIIATAWHVASKWQMHLLVVLTLLAAGFGVLTALQDTAWKDDLTVFTVAHEIAPDNRPVALNLARAQVQEGLKLAESGGCDVAMPVFQRVTREYPDDWFAWAALGDCLVQVNDLPDAEQSLHRAADLSHNPHVIEEWEQLRARLAGSTTTPAK